VKPVQVNSLERATRAHIIQRLRETGSAPSATDTAAALDVPESQLVAALHSLAGQHRIVLLPGSDSVWMAHPFSAIATDFVVHSGGRRWFANCVWDGLAILGLVGDGRLETHSPRSGTPIRFDVLDGRVIGNGIIHFLVPARRFWENIGFT
jgi:hypothetical protein